MNFFKKEIKKEIKRKIKIKIWNQIKMKEIKKNF
jgi:hypothetical protein